MKVSFLLVCVGVLLFFAGGNYAQDLPVGEYQYVEKDDLDKHLEDFVGKKVKFVDELAMFWDDPTEHDSEADVEKMKQQGYKDEFDNQTLADKGYLKFETFYFRCIIDRNITDSINYLRAVNQSKPYEKEKARKTERKLLCIWGTVERTTLHGDVDSTPGGAKDMGTVPELIVIKTDKVEKPDKRYFKEIYLEEEEKENER
jgi:hypothetical protein